MYNYILFIFMSIILVTVLLFTRQLLMVCKLCPGCGGFILSQLNVRKNSYRGSVVCACASF